MVRNAVVFVTTAAVNAATAAAIIAAVDVVVSTAAATTVTTAAATVAAAATVFATSTAATTVAAAVVTVAVSPPQHVPQPQISQRAPRELGSYIPGPEDDDVQRCRTRGETALRQKEQYRRTTLCREVGPGGRLHGFEGVGGMNCR